MNSTQHQAYFEGFTGLLGTKQLPLHLRSVEQWWTLRDDKGRTPLMAEVACKGVSPAAFRTPGAEQILDAVDHNGHNLWFHLFQSRGRMDTNELQGWVDFLGSVPAQPSPLTQRGWMIEKVCQHPRWEHAGEPPEPEAQKVWARLTQGPAHLWWACNEDDAAVFLKWIVNTRIQRPHVAKAMEDFASATLQWPHIEHPWMPPSLKDALMFNSFLAGHEVGEAWVTDKHARGECYELSDKSARRLKANLDQPGWSPPLCERVELLLARNRQLQLERTLENHSPSMSGPPSRKPRF